MTAPNNVPIVNLGMLYVNGLEITNNGTSPDEIINIAAGQCRDSTNVFDMVLSSSVAVSNLLSGVGGLDTGTVAASKVYAVYLISDPISGIATAGILSLSQSQPLMPFGYSAFRKIGYAVTDATSDFLLMKISGNNNYRWLNYDVPAATAVTAGNSATYAAVTLTALVPAVASCPVMIESNWTANAAADTMALQGFGATGDTVKYIAGVAGATAHTLVRDYVQSELDSGVPKINYKVSAGTVAINVAGFQYFI